MALVSVFIPAYNTAAFIGQAVESVLNQKFTDWEIIIVDDASTDNTFALCEDFQRRDKRIKLYRNPVNLGMMQNWIYGLGLCQGKYFAKLDADDLWHRDMLSSCVEVLERYPEVGLTFTRHVALDAAGVHTPNKEVWPEFAIATPFGGARLVRQGIHRMFEGGMLRQGIGPIRRSVFSELGGFTTHDAGDTEMWYRIGAHYKLFGIPEDYYYYRSWDQNFTALQVAGKQKKEINLTEVRQLILDYYHRQRLITATEYRTFSKDNRFELNKYQMVRYRQEGDFRKALQFFLKNLRMSPRRTISFYGHRVWNKVTGKND
jgi:glycosyltransferase involved in cell wall biosynthesis